jgi:hypothetical protein
MRTLKGLKKPATPKPWLQFEALTTAFLGGARQGTPCSPAKASLLHATRLAQQHNPLNDDTLFTL